MRVQRLTERGIFTLEKKRLRRDLVALFQHFTGSYKEDGGSLLLQQERFHLDTRHFLL